MEKVQYKGNSLELQKNTQLQQLLGNTDVLKAGDSCSKETFAIQPTFMELKVSTPRMQ